MSNNTFFCSNVLTPFLTSLFSSNFWHKPVGDFCLHWICFFRFGWRNKNGWEIIRSSSFAFFITLEFLPLKRYILLPAARALKRKMVDVTRRSCPKRLSKNLNWSVSLDPSVSLINPDQRFWTFILCNIAVLLPTNSSISLYNSCSFLFRNIIEIRKRTPMDTSCSICTISGFAFWECFWKTTFTKLFLFAQHSLIRL